MNLVGGFGVDRHPFKKGMKKKIKNKRMQNAGPSQANKKRTDKNQAECFFCKKLGHQKRNYPQYIATLDPNTRRKKKQQGVARQDTYVITPCSFFVCDTTNWILDIESLIDIYNFLQGLQISRRFKDDKRFLNVGDESHVPVQTLGFMELFFESCNVLRSECHYYPTFLLNIISVG